MGRWAVVGVWVAFVLGGCIGAAPEPKDRSRADPPDLRACRRIVSMAPSVTETLFALGVGDRVVGVTQFCDYPTEVRSLPKVGGHLNPNLEAIIALKPDVVVLLTEQEPLRASLEGCHIRTLSVCHQTLEGILESMHVLGRALGTEAKAEAMVADIQARLHRIQAKTAGLARPRVLVVIDRTLEGTKLEGVYVAGCDGVFDKAVRLAGGQSVGEGSPARFPIVSAEGLLRLNPDVIIDLSAGVAQRGVDPEAILQGWHQLRDVAAVRQGRVYLVREDYAFRPGPRLILLVENLARLIHPEVDWDR